MFGGGGGSPGRFLEKAGSDSRSILNDVTDAAGLTNYGAQEKALAQQEAANKRAAEAAEAANAIAREGLEFQKEQYDDWKSVYGDIQENLGEYYKNLGPEKIVSLGLQEQQKAYEQTDKNIRKSMARRGLGDTKFEAYLQTRASMDNASRQAQIRASGQDMVNQQKMNFLGLGIGQGAQMLSNIGNAYGTSVNSRFNQANVYSQQAGMYNQQAGLHATNNAQMMRQIVNTGSSVAGTMYTQKGKSGSGTQSAKGEPLPSGIR